jgi:3-oxoacyl-[acyl-carrier protein] reductase
MKVVSSSPGAEIAPSLARMALGFAIRKRALAKHSNLEITMADRTGVVLVTGASSGIGRACVSHFLKAGFAVCGVDITPRSGSTPVWADKSRYVEFVADISDPAQCNAAVAAATGAFGALDGLAHLAAIHSMKTWSELSAADFEEILSVNVTGSFLISQAAAQYMEKHGGGAIVLTTSSVISVGGLGGNGRGGPAYAASKAAIIGLVRSLARSLAPHHIRVNAVAPGSISTPMTSHYSKEALAGVSARTLAGRIGEADEIARTIGFLMSKDASYIFGEILNVNGGISFGL